MSRVYGAGIEPCHGRNSRPRHIRRLKCACGFPAWPARQQEAWLIRPANTRAWTTALTPRPCGQQDDPDQMADAHNPPCPLTDSVSGWVLACLTWPSHGFTSPAMIPGAWPGECAVKVGLVVYTANETQTNTPRRYEAIRSIVRRAEASGFDSAWLFDHFLYRAAGEPTIGVCGRLMGGISNWDASRQHSW
jgi:hypothetical protein